LATLAGKVEAKRTAAHRSPARHLESARALEALWQAIGQALDPFTPAEWADHSPIPGHVASHRETLLWSTFMSGGTIAAVIEVVREFGGRAGIEEASDGRPDLFPGLGGGLAEPRLELGEELLGFRPGL
jgi:hypothetical protein